MFNWVKSLETVKSNLCSNVSIVAQGPPLKDGSLASNNIVNDCAIYFKDLGVQISWRLVFVLEYLGPIIIVPLLWNFPSLFYRSVDLEKMERSTTQK